METFGKHLIAEMSGCKSKILSDREELEKIMREAAQCANATIVKISSHFFGEGSGGGGVSVMVIIQESHLSVHSWPENNYAAVDIYTCGEKTEPQKAIDFLKEKFRCEKIFLTEIQRGVFNSSKKEYFHETVKQWSLFFPKKISKKGY